MPTPSLNAITPWPHQQRGYEKVLAAIARGQRRLCLTSPTGGGKSLIMAMLATDYLERGQPVALFTQRKFLTEQFGENLIDFGMSHGVRAAGVEEDPDCLLQLCRFQTEHSRVMKKHRRELHAACAGGLVLVDEGHLHTGPTSRALFQKYHEAGAAVVYVTATPIEMDAVADELIVAGTMSELRETGALVYAHHYGCDEPDLRAFKLAREEGNRLKMKFANGEQLTEAEARKLIMTPGIIGRVLDWYRRLNPEQAPSILFAPGVEESVWFAQQFCDAGIRAAHIDGDDVWIDGRLERSNPELRKEIMEGSRDGSIKVLCNRFVLREGIDLPHLEYAIIATLMGFKSYLQSIGRILRASPRTGKRDARIQDHGGHWIRLGSVNEDRQWQLDLSERAYVGMRQDRLRNKKDTGEKEPFLCPNCRRVWVVGRLCSCGHELTGSKRARPVVSMDGTLREMEGELFKPHRVCTKPNGVSLWERMYWRSCTVKGRKTFAAAFALFAHENNFAWPNRSWPLMPKNEDDVHRYVADVPRDRLTSGECGHGSDNGHQMDQRDVVADHGLFS